ncbi:MAG: ABC transporter permease [Planctomycetota bacterium]|nr:ABC transporter permease [Planctomycetota bacterium]
MVPLPLANILHHKVPSALSALGVAIGVCMLVTLSGLARGSLGEVADRWEAVDADLIVYPSNWSDNITTISGGGMSDKDAVRIKNLVIGNDVAVDYVVPVYLQRISIAGAEHNVVGVRPENLRHLLGEGRITEGRIFDPDNTCANWLKEKFSTPSDKIIDISEADLSARGGLEMIIDSRLARASGLKVGDKVYSAARNFTIVGIVPAGAMVRAFIPLATAEHLFYGGTGRYTLLMVKLREDVSIGAATEAIRRQKHLKVIALGEYRAMLENRFGVLYIYVDTVNTITLFVAFLFILVTLLTMVIQRRREIAILRSMGATRRFILKEIVTESLMLTVVGAAAGIAISPAAGAAIETVRPLLTVQITARWMLIAAAAAVFGGVVAAIYPAWRAMNVDVAETLSLE